MIRVFALDDRFTVHSDDYRQQHLHIYRKRREIEVAGGPLDPRLTSNVASQHSWGIIGVIQLLSGRYLLHATQAEMVSSLMGHAVYKIVSVGIIPFSTRRIGDDLPDEFARTEESLYIDMLRSVLTSTHFHFSYSLDLTNTIQTISGIMSLFLFSFAYIHNPASSPSNSAERSFPDLISLANPRFFWNRHVLFELGSTNLSPWAIVLVSGFFCCVPVTVNDHEFQYALFSRRSCLNAGKRFTRRGVDSKGDPTNFAEQEQIVCSAPVNCDSVRVSSFVQTRGSVPLIWSQEASLKWSPPIRISLGSKSKFLLDKHLSDHVERYGRTVLINLVNQSGKEAVVASALSDCVPPYRSGSDHEYSLVSFDFHKKCKNMKYENIELLLEDIQAHLLGSSLFYGRVNASGIWSVDQKQRGCFRTNCMDCLDRTNVVQGAIAKAILISQLQRCEIIGDGNFEMPAALFRTIREVWADNADVMSVLYSGTNALKTDYTRTGKRSSLGACNDGKNSVMRFFQNNFWDGYSQDGLDLFLGNYQVASITKSTDLPYAKAENQDGLSSLFNYFVSRSFLIFLSTLLLSTTVPVESRPAISNVFAFSMLVGPMVSLAMAQTNGRRFVDKPKLLPSRGIAFIEDLDESVSPPLKSE